MLRGRKVLIVEDEQALSDAYQIVLRKEGADVFVAYDGQQALELTEDLEPDIVLLDLRMPRMGGIEFLKAYEPASKHPNTKVLVFSNLDTQSEIDEAYELGAHKYMLKAWASPKELVKLLVDLLGEKQR